MTVVVDNHTANSTPDPHVAPITGAGRWVAATLLVTGAALQVVEFVCEPPQKETAARLDWWVAHPDRMDWSQAAGLLAIPFLVGGFLVMARLARSHSRRLTGAAVVALTGAMAGLAAIHGVELAARWALGSGDRPAAKAILDVTDAGLPGAVLFVMFLGGALVGTVAMDVALWRSPYVPRIAVLLSVAFVGLDLVAGLGRLGHGAALAAGLVLAWAVVTGYVRTPRRIRRRGGE